MKKTMVSIFLILAVGFIVLFSYQRHIDTKVMFVSMYEDNEKMMDINLTTLIDEDKEWIERNQDIFINRWYFKYGLTEAYNPRDVEFTVYLDEKSSLSSTQYYIYINTDKDAPIETASRISVIKRSNVTPFFNRSYSYYLSDEQIDDFVKLNSTLFENYNS